MIRTGLFLLVGLLVAACHSQTAVKQISIDRISGMPDQPAPYKMLDWKEKAINFDEYAFNTSKKGEFLPFVWTDSSLRNLPQKTFGMFTVIGDVRQGPNGSKEFHEALNSMGALLGAGLVGIDKTDQNGQNY